MGSTCQKFSSNPINHSETFSSKQSELPFQNSIQSQKSNSYKSSSQNHLIQSSKEIYSQIFSNSNSNNPLKDQVIQEILSKTEICNNDDSAYIKEKLFSKSRNLGIVDFGPQPQLTSLTKCYYKNNYMEQEDMTLLIPNFFELENLNQQWQNLLCKGAKPQKKKKQKRRTSLKSILKMSKLKEDKIYSMDTESEQTIKTFKTNKTNKTVSFAVQKYKERTKRNKTFVQ